MMMNIVTHTFTEAYSGNKPFSFSYLFLRKVPRYARRQVFTLFLLQRIHKHVHMIGP